MNDIEKRVKIRCRAARSDLDTAALLIQESKLLHGLLFCHYAIEKGLFAHMVRSAKDLPVQPLPILKLLSMANIKVGDQDRELLEDLSNYQIAVRFPESKYNHLSEQKVIEYLTRTR